MTKVFLPAAALALGLALVGGSAPTAAAADGAAGIWKAKCASCHGKEGKGDTKKGEKDKISDMTTAAWQSGITDAAILKSLTDGVDRTKDGVKQKMKAFKDLSAADQADLVKFIRSLKK